VRKKRLSNQQRLKLSALMGIVLGQSPTMKPDLLEMLIRNGYIVLAINGEGYKITDSGYKEFDRLRVLGGFHSDEGIVEN